MNSKDIAALAAGLASGLYTEDSIAALVGDESIVAQIVSLAGGSVVGSAVAGVTRAATELPVVSEVFDIADDVVGGIFDIFD